MRAAIVLLVAMILAGCVRVGEQPSTTTSTTETTPASVPSTSGPTSTSSSSTTTSTPPSTSTTSTPPPSSTPPATARTPPEGTLILNTTFDFTTDAALVPLQAHKTFQVGEGFAWVRANVTNIPKGSASPTDRDRTIGLKAPGDVRPLATGSANPNTKVALAHRSAPGEWSLEFEGKGPVESLIEVRGFAESEWAALQGT